MSKSEKTLELERMIYFATSKQGVFGCVEVTIGWFGNERVDYMTYDTKGVWKCYEIKVSENDFKSKNHNTFIGNYNYYVMPDDLFLKVKNLIPAHIGVYTDRGVSVKKAKRQVLKIDEETLKNSLIRSLSRDAKTLMRNGRTDAIGRLYAEIDRLKNHNTSLSWENYSLKSKIQNLFIKQEARE